ncbi:MAG: hypothetical protein ACOZDD_06430 [Bacteroidota bacterium]
MGTSEKFWRSTIILVLVMVFILPATAQDVKTIDKRVTRTKVPTEAIKVIPTADLSVTSILGGACPSSLPGVDAFYTHGIIVDIQLKDHMVPEALRNETSTVVGTLMVKYFDLVQGREVTHNLMLERGRFMWVASQSLSNARINVINSPVLVKKSVGITARVSLNIPGYATADPEMGNNEKVIRECIVLLE